MQAPMHAQLVVDFVNSYKVGDGKDALSSAADLDDWLAEHAPSGAGRGRTARCTAQDVVNARELRDELRGVLARDATTAATATAEDRAVAQVAARFPLVVDLTSRPPALRPDGSGGTARIGEVAAAIATAAADGSWARIKVCQSHTCLRAFYDASKNGSRTWCSMRVCGNRAKTAAYRGRQRPRGNEGAATGRQPV